MLLAWYFKESKENTNYLTFNYLTTSCNTNFFFRCPLQSPVHSCCFNSRKYILFAFPGSLKSKPWTPTWSYYNRYLSLISRINLHFLLPTTTQYLVYTKYEIFFWDFAFFSIQNQPPYLSGSSSLFTRTYVSGILFYLGYLSGSGCICLMLRSALTRTLE